MAAHGANILILWDDLVHWAASPLLSFTLMTWCSQYDWIFTVPSLRMKV